MQEFDITINGGGIVGLTLALDLANNTPLQIAIIDATKPLLKWQAQDRDLRVSNVNFAQQQYFEKLGAWDDMRETASPFTKIIAWDGVGKSQVTFDSHEIGRACLGYIIENRVIKRALWQALQQFEQVKCFFPMTITDAQIIDNHVQVTLQDQSILTADCLVGADGAQSWVRQHFNLKLHQSDYGQQALVANIHCEKSHFKTARQVFLPTGPLAFLPLNDPHLVSIVWSTDPQQAASLLEMSTSQFNQTLTEASEQVLGQLSCQSKRVMFPLIKRRVREMVQSRIALCGDAAHTIHPLAGQGLNLGLKDVEVLAQILQQAKAKQRDIGHSMTLRKYERSRKADIISMMAAMDGFKALFTNDKKPLVELRNLGFQLTNQSSLLKKAFMLHAIG